MLMMILVLLMCETKNTITIIENDKAVDLNEDDIGNFRYTSTFCTKLKNIFKVSSELPKSDDLEEVIEGTLFFTTRGYAKLSELQLTNFSIIANTFDSNAQDKYLGYYLSGCSCIWHMKMGRVVRQIKFKAKTLDIVLGEFKITASGDVVHKSGEV